MEMMPSSKHSVSDCKLRLLFGALYESSSKSTVLLNIFLYPKFQYCSNHEKNESVFSDNRVCGRISMNVTSVFRDPGFQSSASLSYV